MECNTFTASSFRIWNSSTGVSSPPLALLIVKLSKAHLTSTLTTSWEELTHWKRPWCWEGFGAGGEGDDKGWDGWMASPTLWMWELDCEESWAPKNWWFWTVVLEKTLESSLDYKEIQPVHPERDQSWVFIGRTEVKAETPLLWPPHAKSWLFGKVSDAGRH